MRSRVCTTPLSRRLPMCAQAAYCRSSRNCRRCGIALPNPGSGGTEFERRSAPIRSLSNCRAWVLSVAVSRNSQKQGEDLMGFRLRMILWIPALAYAGFLLLGGKNLASLGQVVFAMLLGALLGFLLAAMFTIRQLRREKRVRLSA
jgi:hypothetical protein